MSLVRDGTSGRSEKGYVSIFASRSLRIGPMVYSRVAGVYHRSEAIRMFARATQSLPSLASRAVIIPLLIAVNVASARRRFGPMSASRVETVTVGALGQLFVSDHDCFGVPSIYREEGYSRPFLPPARALCCGVQSLAVACSHTKVPVGQLLPLPSKETIIGMIGGPLS